VAPLIPAAAIHAAGVLQAVILSLDQIVFAQMLDEAGHRPAVRIIVTRGKADHPAAITAPRDLPKAAVFSVCETNPQISATRRQCVEGLSKR